MAKQTFEKEESERGIESTINANFTFCAVFFATLDWSFLMEMFIFFQTHFTELNAMLIILAPSTYRPPDVGFAAPVHRDLIKMESFVNVYVCAITLHLSDRKHYNRYPYFNGKPFKPMDN